MRGKIASPLAATVLVASALGAVVATGTPGASNAEAALARPGQGFTLNAGDMRHILKQIKIAENHATKEGANGQPVAGAPLVGTGPNQIASSLLPYGLRTVDGSENNLEPGQNSYGAAHQTFPRIAPKSFMDAEDSNIPGMGPVGPPGMTSYKQKRGNVVDSRPRTISNLVVDQTETNPAAVKAAGKPHRTFLGEPVIPCSAPGAPPAGECVPKGETLFIPNVTTDVGLSPPYNSWFTIFGQFFDHGVDSTAKEGGTVFVPLKDDDPLIAGPDGARGTTDDLDPSLRFMVLTRAKNQPGLDGVMGTADDVQDATNTDTPWVDQSQTYTSHPSHQVFLRDYALVGGRPVSTGTLLEGDAGGMSTWRDVKEQAATELGIRLEDEDALDVPMLATDQYGRFLRGRNRGLPQIVTPSGLIEGNRAAPVDVPANAGKTGVAFLDDIAQNAVPKAGLTPDTNTGVTGAKGQQAAGTYDDEMLDAHFIAGDGRVNENIALTAVHQVFHSEHNRLVDYMKKLIVDKNIDVAEWKSATGADGWNGERLFQASRFVTEMEYQHLVFEEFGRKVAPGIDPFNPATQSQTDLNPAVRAEFAHAVYRFGHSMLTETVSRTNNDGSTNDIELLDAFLNPQSYTNGGNGRVLTPEEAAGSIAMGMTDQVGNELDEFVTDTLRNNLLGLPLDLATLNMTRARDTGVPSLNNFRKEVYKQTHDGALKPYASWLDYGLSLKHVDSLVNFMAAYGEHPTIKNASTLAGKRAAAQLIYDNDRALNPSTPLDAAAFLNSTGTWANVNGNSVTGLDSVDLWVGGLAESQNLFGGLLGSTFNYVFEQQMFELQSGDRLYYLTRTPGMNLRTQLEGNSFAELVMRNTDARSLKADVFSTADCEFELANLPAPAVFSNTIQDDPTSECNESLVLIRMADGTIRYRQSNSVDPPGLNAQSTFNGTNGPDRIHGGVDNDTFWGNEGKDRIEGSDGGDVALGGEDDDVITDSAGDDNLKGGAGDDALDAGPGLDLVQSGDGDDFSDGGMNSNTTFAGEGDDKAIGGGGPDTVIGDGGDDWMEGGNANDLLVGDSSAPFFDDPNDPGHDVMIGDGGEDDYDAEGGDDIMVAGSGIERNYGAFGFDWSTHHGDPQAAASDLTISIAAGPTQLADRFLLVEGLSGWEKDDSLKGDGIVPFEADVELRGPWGANVLTQAGISRISGLAAVVDGNTECRTDARTGTPKTVCGFGKGNVILGGGGSDTIEGRGADDVIDGDKWLKVQLRAPDVSTPAAGDTKLVDSMTDLRDDVFAGRIDPGEIKVVRSVETATPAAGAQPVIDTAVYTGPRADYDITLSTGRVKVTHARNVPCCSDQGVDLPNGDGIDTLSNIERLRFSDQTVTLEPVAGLTPASLAFGSRQMGSLSASQNVTLRNTGTLPLSIQSITRAGANPGDYTIANNACGASLAAGANCIVAVRFNPTAPGASATLRVAQLPQRAGERQSDHALRDRRAGQPGGHGSAHHQRHDAAAGSDADRESRHHRRRQRPADHVPVHLAGAGQPADRRADLGHRAGCDELVHLPGPELGDRERPAAACGRLVHGPPRLSGVAGVLSDEQRQLGPRGPRGAGRADQRVAGRAAGPEPGPRPRSGAAAAGHGRDGGRRPAHHGAGDRAGGREHREDHGLAVHDGALPEGRRDGVPQGRRGQAVHVPPDPEGAAEPQARPVPDRGPRGRDPRLAGPGDLQGGLDQARHPLTSRRRRPWAPPAPHTTRPQAAAHGRPLRFGRRRTSVEVVSAPHGDLLQLLEYAAAGGYADAPDVDELRRVVGLAADELRGFVDGEPLAVAPHDLATALAHAACDGRVVAGGLKARMVVEPLGIDVPQGATEALAGAVREALVNAAKHARARRAAVRCVVADGAVVVVVHDDGIGFDPALVRMGCGLRDSIAGRLARIGGSARVESAPGKGTRVTLTFPLSAPLAREVAA